MANVSNFFGKVGRSLKGASNIADALSLAGLNFDVQTEAVRDIRGNVIPDTLRALTRAKALASMALVTLRFKRQRLLLTWMTLPSRCLSPIIGAEC